MKHINNQIQKFFMDLIQTIILGLLQGFTEWLPISSSGHLVIAQKLMGLTIPIGFYAMLHVGTLLGVFIFFWRDIRNILKSLIHHDTKGQYFKIFENVLIGIIPTAVIAVIFLKFFESLFYDMKAVGIGFLITGGLLLLSKLRNGNKGLNKLSSLLIGIAQGASIAPGISRSGSTISVGLLSGLKKEDIFRYSFLLSVPVMIGWCVLEYKGLMIPDLSIYSAIGMILSAISGYFAIRVVKKMLLSEKFHLFAAYCFILGIFVLLYLA